MTDPMPIDPSDQTPVPGQETHRLPAGMPLPPVEGTIRLEAEGVAEALSTGALPDQTLQLKTGPPPPPPPPLVLPPVPSPYTTHPLPPPPAVKRGIGLWAALAGAALLGAALGGLALFRPGLLGLGARDDAPQVEASAPAAEDLPPPAAVATPPRGAEVPPALRSYHDKALKGDANAMAVLGTMYYNGLNVPADRAEGLKWLRRAADQGNAAAKKQLAQLEGR